MNRTTAIAIGLAGMLLSGLPTDAAPQKPAKTSETKGRPRKKPEPPPPEPVQPVPGPGDKRRIIGVLDVRVDGAPPDVGAQFQRDLESQVDVDQFYLAPRTRMREIMANSTRWSEGCLVGPCLADVKSQSNADVVLLAALSGGGTSFGWVVTLVRTDSGNVLSQRAERCDVCTVNEALSAAALATVDLLSSIPDALPDERPKVVPTSPSDALLRTRIDRLEHRQRATAIGLTIAGAAIAAAGTALYFAQTPHPTYGVAAAFGGLGLAAGGLVLLF